jgi:hypothetical protein
MKNRLIILYIFISICCYSQNSIYKWNTGTKAYIGEFDSTIISRSMLDDMCMLCNKFIPYPMLWRYQQAESPDTILYKLDSINELSIKWINSLNILDTPKWENIKNYRIDNLIKGSQYTKTLIEAYKNPTILEERYPLDTCSELIQVMKIDGDSMIHFWKEYIYQECYNSNSDPEGCYDRLYKSKIDKDYTFKFVRFELLVRWTNCYAQNHQRDYEYINLNEEFKSLFINVKSYYMYD